MNPIRDRDDGNFFVQEKTNELKIKRRVKPSLLPRYFFKTNQSSQIKLLEFYFVELHHYVQFLNYELQINCKTRASESKSCIFNFSR